MKALLIAAIACLCLLPSCGKEEAIKGRPVSQWIERLDDRDEETRMIAAIALLDASPDALKPARKRLLQLANSSHDARDAVAAQWVMTQKFGIRFD